MKRLNDRYACYGLFLLVYFLSFGLSDLGQLSAGSNLVQDEVGAITLTELVILAGAGAFMFGYLLAARAASAERAPQKFLDEWPKSIQVYFGGFLWLLGLAASIYFSIKFTIRLGEFRNDQGPLVLTMLVLGRYMLPLGILILAYVYITSRSFSLFLVAIAMCSCQVVIGFASDSKETAMLGGIMIILAGVLATARIPKGWAIGAALFVVFGFPVIQAHRFLVTYDRGMTNAQSALNLGASLNIILENIKELKKEHNVFDSHTASLFDRLSMKGSVHMIVSRTGADVPFQNGKTLWPMLTVFVPRILLPSKLDVQTGLVMNKEFSVTGDNITYISPSYLGDLYWNFGWAGVLAGMSVLGLVLGIVGTHFDLSKGVSVARLLVVAITAYSLCARFEGALTPEFSIWIRSLLGITVLHLVLAKRGYKSLTAIKQSGAHTQPQSAAPKQAPFPNLLR